MQHVCKYFRVVTSNNWIIDTSWYFRVRRWDTPPSTSGVAARVQAEVRSLVRKDDRKECDRGCKGNRKSPQDGGCHKMWNCEFHFAWLAVGQMAVRKVKFFT